MPRIASTWKRRSSDDFLYRPAAFFHQVERAAERLVLHFCVVEAKLVQNGRVQVAVIVAMLHSLIAHIVGSAMNYPALDASAGQQYSVALGVMIPPGCVLRPRAAAKLAADHD